MDSNVVEISEWIVNRREGGRCRVMIEKEDAHLLVVEEARFNGRSVRQHIARHPEADWELAIADYNQRLEQLAADGWVTYGGRVPKPIDELPGYGSVGEG